MFVTSQCAVDAVGMNQTNMFVIVSAATPKTIVLSLGGVYSLQCWFGFLDAVFPFNHL